MAEEDYSRTIRSYETHCNVLGKGGYSEVHKVFQVLGLANIDKIYNILTSQVTYLTASTYIMLDVCTQDHEGFWGNHSTGYRKRVPRDNVTVQSGTACEYSQRSGTRQISRQVILHRYGIMRFQLGRIYI